MYRDEQAARLRGERERLLDGPLPAGPGSAFRQEIMSSWQRCQLVGVRPAGLEVPYQAEFERPNRLLRAAGPVIEWLAGQLEDGPISILLADSDAQIVERRVGRRELANALDKALVSPGFLYAEEFTGTNGIGTALETATPFMVSGSEHFRENLQEFTCVGSPLKHPVSGKIEGVLDVTCRVGDNHGVIKPMVLAAVREIESRMGADASRREQLLLEHFVRANRRATSAVISLNEDVVIANTAASALLDLSDQAALWDWACRVLGTSDQYTGEIRLAGDDVAQARATRVNEDGPTAGVVLEIRPRSCGDGRAVAARRSSRARRGEQRADDRLPGRSVAARRLRDDAEAALGTERPVLVCGEPGAGKLHVARYLHRRRAGADPLTVLDAAAAADDPGAWTARVNQVLAAGGTVVLHHLDQLPDGFDGRMEAVIEGAPPARVIATARARNGRGAGRLLDHFPFSVTVPPLRYRLDDLCDLAPALLAAHTAQRPLPRLLPGTVRALTALDWPGNVRELEAVLATAAQRSLGSDIGQEHLPPEYRSGTRPGSASLQRAELDIILEALAETRGNKLAAAERLGIARSTLYRKMRMLGIDEKHLPAAARPR